MTFKTHNEMDVDTAGTSLKGRVSADVTYDRIVEVFGQPEGTRDPIKYSVMWQIQFSDGKVATIYDWKSRKPAITCVGDDWYIGGNDLVEDIVNSLLA